MAEVVRKPCDDCGYLTLFNIYESNNGRCIKCVKSSQKRTLTESAFYKSKHYYDLSEATGDVQFASGVQETTSAVVKLAGKSLFNAGIVAGKTGFFLGKAIVRNSPDIAARMLETGLKQSAGRMDAEQTNRVEEFTNKNKGKKLW